MAFKSYYKLVKYEKPLPFYVEDVSGNANTVSIKKYNASAPTLTIETSTDNRAWTTLGQTDTTELNISVPANSRVYVRCSANSWSGYVYYYNNYFNTATGNFKVGGNIMSLLYGSNFTGEETVFPNNSSNTFSSLFYRNPKIVDASDLILPATVLKEYSYAHMFDGCTSLTTALALPATTLAANCYDGMFAGCTNLTQAPELPSTTLATNCYSTMFQNCSALATAPTLPAVILVNGCYRTMFNGCSSLNSVTCLATDITASDCTTNWLNSVPATGTFTKSASMSSWTTGVDGIPIGWTVQDAQ